MNIKRLVCIFLVTVLIAIAFPFSVFAASSVTVALPGFSVTLGGQTIVPENEEYPFIVYRDITYLPLTYYGCQLLGLYSEWTPKQGLSISDLGVKGKYISSPRVSSNAGRLSAKIASGSITINGSPIDNTRQTYPFLLFRDITYIPMTWNNMHDLLGCDYSFDGENGLVIDRNAQSGSILRLPLREDFYSIASYAGYFWYVDTNGNISRTPMSGGLAEQVFEVPINSTTGSKASPSLSVRDDKLYMTYHVGGAVMGSDVQICFSPDGSFDSLGGSGVDDEGNIVYYGTKNTYLDGDKYRIAANHFTPPINNNLSILYDGSDEWKQLGEEQYIYAWYIRQVQDGGMSGISCNELYERNGVVYTLGINSFAGLDPDRLTEAYKKYRKYCDPNVTLPYYSCVVAVDIKTGKTTELTEPAMKMKLIGDEIWYVTAPDGALKKCDLDGTHVETVVAKSEGPVADFWVINDTVFFTVYYKNEEASVISWLYKVIDSGYSKGVQRIGLTPPSSVSVQGDYLLALLHSAEEIADYPVAFFSDHAKSLIKKHTSIPRLVVYDSKSVYAEDSLFSINDTNVLAAGIADDKLYYVVK